MKIKIHSSEINRMMKIISQCIDQRFSNYSNIEICHEDNLLKIRGTNGTYQATVSTPLLGGDGEKFCVDGTMFARVCAMCNGEIEINADEKNCVIRGTGRTRLPVMDVTVTAQERVNGKTAAMSSDDFMKCYNSVAYAIAADQTRIQLTGVLTMFDGNEVTMVTLDGFQMSMETAGCDGDEIRMTVPGSFMKLVGQGLSVGEKVTFCTNGSRLEAFTDSMVLTCGLLTGDYPDYNRILPKDFKTECIVKVDELRNALKCGSIINTKQNLVKLDIGADSISVMSNGEEASFDADVACSTHGEGLKIAFNQKYLMNSINAINTEEAVMKFNNSVSPCVVTGKDEDGVHLLLPVRVQG